MILSGSGNEPHRRGAAEYLVKRCNIYTVRSDRKFIIVRVYYQIFVDATNSYRPKGRGIRPYRRNEPA